MQLLVHKWQGIHKQSSTRMRAGPGKSWPRRAAPRSGCSLVPAQIRMLDCCSHMSFHLWPLWSTACCHDHGPYHFSTARCHGNGPDCTTLHAILQSKCIRDVTEHVGTLNFATLRFLARPIFRQIIPHPWLLIELRWSQKNLVTTTAYHKNTCVLKGSR